MNNICTNNNKNTMYIATAKREIIILLLENLYEILSHCVTYLLRENIITQSTYLMLNNLSKHLIKLLYC